MVASSSPSPLSSQPAPLPARAAPLLTARGALPSAPGPRPAAPAPLLIRDLGPPDGQLVDDLHAALSPRSRYQRYHGAKPTLSSRDRAFLTGTDGYDHVALVAIEAGGAPVGIARYVRLRGEPRTADIAAEVADRRQGQGLGTELIAGVARRAAASGIERFTATVLSDTRLRASLVRRGWRVRSFDGPTTTLEADVWTLLQASRA
jgi:RimJ/RimL family protein N-acetyltransferase